jgi:hypothetical protein
VSPAANFYALVLRIEWDSLGFRVYFSRNRGKIVSYYDIYMPMELPCFLL